MNRIYCDCMHKLFDDINRVIDACKYLTLSNQKGHYINNWHKLFDGINHVIDAGKYLKPSNQKRCNIIFCIRTAIKRLFLIFDFTRVLNQISFCSLTSTSFHIKILDLRRENCERVPAASNVPLCCIFHKHDI